MPSQLSAPCSVYICIFYMTLRYTRQTFNYKVWHFFEIFFADSLVVLAPHQNQTGAELVEQLAFTP